MKRQRLILLGILSLLVAASVWAQAPARQTFEVATIRVHQNQSDPAQNDLLPDGRFAASNIPLKKLLRIALSVEDDQVAGLPGWADSATYGIDARTGTAATITVDEMRVLVRSLLEDRFEMKFHRVPKERPIYWMVVAKGGAKLKAHTGDAEAAMSTNGNATTMC